MHVIVLLMDVFALKIQIALVICAFKAYVLANQMDALVKTIQLVQVAHV